MKTFDQLWAEILEEFDWQNVHHAMKMLNLKWVDDKIYEFDLVHPSVDQLQRVAKIILHECWTIGMTDGSDANCVSTGGLTAYFRYASGQPILRLSFELADWETCGEDGDEVTVELMERKLDPYL